MASQEKRCLYEVLGVGRDCNADEIRSAYKKLALQRHPDKLVQSGVPEAEATAAFQELVNAYEVLSDPRERSWYDSNRSKILFSSSSAGPNNSSKFGSVPNLFSFFSNSVYYGFSDTGKGFYKVYADVFDKVYQNELNFAKKLGLSSPKEAPLMGNMSSPYAQVIAFYNYWLGFTTVMDFCWADQYDVMAGMNRKSRRVMEDENKKLRKKARREYNDTVRGLAEFVKKRDKRVIDMQLKRNEEIERKREEEQARKKELAKLKAERAKKYQEPEWIQVDDLEDEAEETWEEDDKKEEGNELYCIACGKKFKSDKQWKNHEQSKKHKEKVVALREALSDEDKVFEETDVNGGNEHKEQKSPQSDESGYLSAIDDAVDESGEQFEGSFGIERKSDDEEDKTTGRAGCTRDGQEDSMGAAVESGSDDDEASVLEAMVSGYGSKTKLVVQDAVDELGEQFEGSFGIERKSDDEEVGTTEKARCTSDGQDGSDDDEASVLETMVSGHRSRKHVVSNHHPKVKKDDNEMNFMEYNNLKGTGRRRGARKRRNRRAEGEMRVDDEEADEDEPSSQVVKSTGYDEEEANEDEPRPSSQFSPKTKTDGKEDDSSDMVEKTPKQAAIGNRGNTKKDNNTKSKNASKGRKEKTTSKHSDYACEKCGEEFESRNKLHKHLGETGHASFKSR